MKLDAKDRRWLLSRRALLGGIGALGLSSLLPARRARAQSTGAPKRFIVVHVPEGMWDGAPRPHVGASTLGTLLGALDPYRTQMTVMNGLELRSRDHGPGGDGHHRGVPHMLTCTEMLDDTRAGGPSIDQAIASHIGADTRFESLQLATRIVYGDTNAACIWKAAGQRLPAMEDPQQAFERVFANVDGDVTGDVGGFDLKRSILDRSLGEIATLRQRLPAADRARLDTYQASLRDIETRLQNGGACSAPPGFVGSDVDPFDDDNYEITGRLQMDLMVAALQCDLTRVASFQWGNSNDQSRYPFIDVNTLGHDMAHNNNDCDPNGAKKVKVTQFYARQFKYLLDKLAAVNEGAGTMLDNTTILWVSEFSDCNAHDASDLMWMLMGNAGGALQHQGVVDFGGRSVSDLHTTLLNAFGIAADSFGNPAYCDGRIDELLA